MPNLHVLKDLFTSGYLSPLLALISALSILCGVSVITAKNPIVSVLYLIGLFFSIAMYLMSLGLSFIGLSYLLVYVGAVSILFLFILMLINVRISELVTDNSNSLILAVFIGLFIIAPIYAKGNYHNVTNNSNYHSNIDKILEDNLSGPNAITNSVEEIVENGSWSPSKDFMQPLNNMFENFTFYEGNGMDHVYFVTSKTWDGALWEMSHITTIGSVIYTSYPLWLIITSIILLLAMVGAIVITIKQR